MKYNDRHGWFAENEYVISGEASLRTPRFAFRNLFHHAQLARCGEAACIHAVEVRAA
jgi:hypothetical protein